MDWDDRFARWLKSTNFAHRRAPIHYSSILGAWLEYEYTVPRDYWEELKRQNVEWFFTEGDTKTTIYISRPGQYTNFTGNSRNQAAQMALNHLETYW
jgi:hypothetical protein